MKDTKETFGNSRISPNVGFYTQLSIPLESALERQHKMTARTAARCKKEESKLWQTAIEETYSAVKHKLVMFTFVWTAWCCTVLAYMYIDPENCALPSNHLCLRKSILVEKYDRIFQKMLFCSCTFKHCDFFRFSCMRGILSAEG
jgi:hypothetical protein